ncbi:MAG: hypothetical protein AAGA70_15625 [Pseudomonadota bacterium]
MRDASESHVQIAPAGAGGPGAATPVDEAEVEARAASCDAAGGARVIGVHCCD